MTIEKALELLQAIVLTGEYKGDPDDADAIKFAIEVFQFLVRLEKSPP